MFDQDLIRTGWRTCFPRSNPSRNRLPRGVLAHYRASQPDPIRKTTSNPTNLWFTQAEWGSSGIRRQFSPKSVANRRVTRPFRVRCERRPKLTGNDHVRSSHAAARRPGKPDPDRIRGRTAQHPAQTRAVRARHPQSGLRDLRVDHRRLRVLHPGAPGSGRRLLRLAAPGGDRDLRLVLHRRGQHLRPALPVPDRLAPTARSGSVAATPRRTIPIRAGWRCFSRPAWASG